MRDPFIIYFFTIFFSAASKPTPPCVDYCKDGLCLYESDFCDGTGMCSGKIIIEKLKDNLGIIRGSFTNFSKEKLSQAVIQNLHKKMLNLHKKCKTYTKNISKQRSQIHKNKITKSQTFSCVLCWFVV